MEKAKTRGSARPTTRRLPGDRAGTSGSGKRPGCGRALLLIVLVFGLLIGLSTAYDRVWTSLYLRPGIAYFEAGQYGAAEHDLRWYLRFENDPTGHYWMGRTLLAEGRTAQARWEFLKDVQQVSKYGMHINARSRYYLRQL